MKMGIGQRKKKMWKEYFVTTLQISSLQQTPLKLKWKRCWKKYQGK